MAEERGDVERTFSRAFFPVARRVQRRLTAKRALSFAGFGLAIGAPIALASWAWRLGELRPFAAFAGVLGAALGVLVARRRRWSESEVALYLDVRLASRELLTTAVHARHAEDAASVCVVERAAEVLAQAASRRVEPPLWSRAHLVLPFAAVAIAVVSFLPLPRAPAPALAAPGAERVSVRDLKGLDRIEALSELRGRNPEQDARLAELSARARKLRQSLERGVEKREALSEIAKLRDGIAGEQLKFADQQNRAGLDAALTALSRNPALDRAQRALGQGDLTAFDEEMQKLANRAESGDRRAAKEALEQAAKAARERGARALSDALEAQRRLFDQRENRAEALRELLENLTNNLSPEALNDLKEFGGSGDPKTKQRLEKALERTLESLTPEERKRLAARLKQRLKARDGSLSPMSKRELQDLAEDLKDGGEQALKEQLRELAQSDPSEDAERERRLADADRGGRDAERGLGALPLPLGADGASKGGARDTGDGAGSKTESGGPGGHRDAARGDHSGSTAIVPGQSLRAKANAQVLPFGAAHSTTLGRAPARAGERANLLGTGILGEARRAEVGAVEGADIPEEYREQVGRYFEP